MVLRKPAKLFSIFCNEKSEIILKTTKYKTIKNSVLLLFSFRAPKP